MPSSWSFSLSKVLRWTLGNFSRIDATWLFWASDGSMLALTYARASLGTRPAARWVSLVLAPPPLPQAGRTRARHKARGSPTARLMAPTLNRLRALDQPFQVAEAPAPDAVQDGAGAGDTHPARQPPRKRQVLLPGETGASVDGLQQEVPAPGDDTGV